MMIETPRTQLQEVTLDDIRDILRSNDEEIRLLLQLTKEEDIEPYRNRYKRLVGMQPKNWIKWIVRLKEDSTIIGDCVFHNIVHHHRRGEIGYRLYPQHHRQGYMSEIVPFMLQHGFNHLNLHRIEALTAPDNEASIKILENNNFSYEGILRENYIQNGVPGDSKLFSLLATEFVMKK